MLFQSIAQVKNVLGLAISQDVSLNDITPYIKEAEENYLLPLLGKPLHTKLCDQTGLNTIEQEALELAQTFTACRALYDTFDINGVSFASGGNTRVEADNIKTPYKYQGEAFKASNLNRAYSALDNLHQLLGTNVGSFPLLSAKEVKYLCAGWLNTAKDMQRVLYRSINRQTFDEIRPLIREVERFLLCSTIGKAQYETLFAEISSEIVEEPEGVYFEMQAAIAEFAFKEAIARKLVTIQGGVIVRQELSGDDATTQLLTPSNDQMAFTTRHLNEFANRHVAQYRQLMLDNPDDFPEFIEWNTAQEAALQEKLNTANGNNATLDNDNEDWNSIFGANVSTTIRTGPAGRIF